MPLSRVTAVGVLLVVAALSGACRDTAAAPERARSAVAIGSRGSTLGVQGRRLDSGSSSVEVTWKGLRGAAILAVTLDSPLAAGTRTQAVREQGTALHGITLLRRVEGDGSEKLTVLHERLATALGERAAVVTVRVFTSLQAEVLAGDPSVLGGQHVERIDDIAPADLTERFRLVTDGDSTDVLTPPVRLEREHVVTGRRLVALGGELAPSVRTSLRLR